MKKWTLVLAMAVCTVVAARMGFAGDTLAGANGTTGNSSDGERKHGRHGDHFARMDTNGDGKISFDEFKAHVLACIAKRQSEGKGSGKGQPSDEKLRKRFDKIDANKDGFLSKEEFAAAIKKHKEHKKDDGNSPKEKTNSSV